jgi:small basic protein
VILIPILAFIVGALLAFIVQIGPLPGKEGQYLAVACLAGLDTVFGGIRGGLEGKFRSDVFVTGFFSNVLIAFFLAWLGDQIYLNLFLAVALVLGARIFTNLSLIRRYALTRWQDARERAKLQQAAAQQQSGSSE